MTATRQLGNAGWDIVVRGSGLIALIAIPVVLLIPQSESLTILTLATIWMRGPASALMPVGLEPVLMLFGRLHPPLLVAVVAALGSAYAEVLSLHLARGVLDLRRLHQVRGSIQGSRMMRLFNRSPFLAVWFSALSPIPDWITRTLAAAARYPAARYVLADTIGRFPKLWAAAALGNWLNVSTHTLGVLVGASFATALAVGAWKLYRRFAVPRFQAIVEVSP